MEAKSWFRFLSGCRDQGKRRRGEKTEEQGLKRDDGEKGMMQSWFWWWGGVPQTTAVAFCHTVRQGIPGCIATRHNDKSACQPNTVQQDSLEFELPRLTIKLRRSEENMKLKIHTEELIFVSGR